MRGRSMLFFIIIFSIFTIIDIYAYKGLKLAVGNSEYFTLIKYIHWLLLPLITIGTIITLKIYPMELGAKSSYYLFFFSGLLILIYGSKIIFTAFHLTEDILNGIYWLADLTRRKIFGIEGGFNYSRIALLTKIGFGFLILFMLLFAKGMLIDRFRYKIHKYELISDRLPKSFNNLKIVQISDIHVGCFYNNDKKLQNAVNMINDLNPDLVLFTGDMVINLAKELYGFSDILSGIKSKYGVYSVLGNHDYGDYANWKSPEERSKNIHDLINRQNKMGFQMLMNENRILTINGDSIAIIGIENWGLPPFPQHGDLQKAISGTDVIPFKILLSHDPTHWDEEVVEKTDIDLTLSGHTHGMQFGIFNKYIKWSPVKLKYKKWGGMYQSGNQYLHINVGLGSIAYPGRVGVRPEITLITLKKGR